MMKTETQNPAQYERGSFPFGDRAIPDIRYDPVFKAVFTKETAESRIALSDLISALIGRTVTVEAITANEPPTDDSRQRYLRFDVACKTEKSELVNVEMSFNPKTSEQVRLEYHTARLFVGQDIHGKDKKYNDLKETYQIAILAKRTFFPDENFVHNFLYYDPNNRISLGGKTRIITVELVKTEPIVDKPVEEMTTAEQWAVFFQYLTDKEKRGKIIEIINQEEGIAMAVETLGTFTQSELEYIYESSRIKGELDYQNDMAEAREEARLEGRNEGFTEGRNEGFTEGRNEGFTKGRNEASLDIARKMKTMGDSIEKIHAVTGLPMETITQLSNNK
jgi:predicted transposase/invertase (TIGR01784 family)